MELKDIEIRINKPYPELTNVKEDKSTVAILKNLASSRVGELAGILQYIYQSTIADKTNEDIASIFEEIGVAEMVHLDLLMHAISEFGGVPRYEDSQGNSFSTSTINYSMKLKDMLENNIEDEKFAIENYQLAKSKVANQSLKDLFDRIIEDEKRHLEVFKQIKNNVQFMSV